MARGHGRALDSWLKRMPSRRRVPFQINRHDLYRIADLYAGYNPGKPESWIRTFDHEIYRWTRDRGNSVERVLKPYEVIAERLHDVAIGRAIKGFLMRAARRTKKPVIGFMGGHSVLRTEKSYREIALIARQLRQQQYTIVSGGGPGLMEAANFGAFMAPYKDSEFDQALSQLGVAPDLKDPAGWIATAVQVRTSHLRLWNGAEKSESFSLGVPTWYYGSEPPNLFASHSGKYFFNSVREDGLVSICDGGIIFGPGEAGTVQEVFQDATLNFYLTTPTATPMILFGTGYWNPSGGSGEQGHSKPVYPLLETLAMQAGNPFDSKVMVTDDAASIVAFITKGSGVRYALGQAPKASVPLYKGRATAAF